MSETPAGKPELLQENVRAEAPRISWSDWLGTFLEKRNIFWGELVGGLLVVGCSIALLLSLWQTLESIPLFPFLAAATGTAALYGIGRYSLSHWKLESSSRNLLVIATLLVPLNFLVLAGISPRSNEPIELIAKIAALMVFTLMVRGSGRILLPDPENRRAWSRGWLLPLAMVGPSLAPLMAARAYEPQEATWLFALLLALPVACHTTAIGGAVLAHRRAGTVGFASAPVLGWVGFASYALVGSIAFLAFWVVSRGGSITEVLLPLAGPAVVAGASILAAGLFVQRRANVPSEGEAPTGALGAAATMIALLGGLVQLAAFGMAWPERWSLLFVGMANYVILTAVALRFRFAPAQLLALPSLLVSFLAATSLAWSPDASGFSLGENAGLTGTALVGLVLLLVVAADRLLRFGRIADAHAYQIGAGLIGLLSLGLAASDAVAEPRWAVYVGVAYITACFVLSRRWHYPLLEQIGIILTPLTTLAALHWAIPNAWPRWTALLAFEALAFSALRANWWRSAGIAALLAGAAMLKGWSDFGSTWNPATFFLLAAAALVQAIRWRFVTLTWSGCALLLAGIAHALLLSMNVSLAVPWVTVLLAYASLALVAILLWPRRAGDAATSFKQVVVLPFRVSALTLSVVAAALLLKGIDRPLLGAQALASLWLGGIWLLADLVERQPPWFAAFQIAATLAAALGVGHLLEVQARAAGTTASFTNPAAVYAFGLGLGGMALLWALLRRLLERRSFFRVFYEAPEAFDRLLLGALVAGQLVVASWLVLPEIAREVFPAGAIDLDPVFQAATMPSLAARPWQLLGLLASALLLTIRSRDSWRRTSVLAGLGAIAVSAALLAAGRAAPELASASALRWGLASACLAVAIPSWARRRSREGADGTSALAPWSIGIGVPVIFLSAISAMMILGGSVSAGPAADSFFARIYWSASHGIPLAVIAFVLLGHAVREQRAHHALAAGLLMTFSAGLGYAVESVLAGVPFDEHVIVAALQRATAAAALISAAWIAAVKFARGQADTANLWDAQQGMAVGGNFLLLVGAAFLLTVDFPPVFGPSISPAYAKPAAWTTAVANGWGWAALALTAAAGWLRGILARWSFSPNLVALSLLGAVVMIAATIAGNSPTWGYRSILFGAAAFSLVGAALARRSTAFDPWVVVACGVTVALAIKATLVHGDSLTAIPGLSVASIAGLWLCGRRERPDWANLASIVVQLTIATAIWHGFRPRQFDDWAAYWLQAAVVGAALLLLIGPWLRDRGRVGPNQFMALQLIVIGCGLLRLFGRPAIELVLNPASVPSAFALQVGKISGLASLLVAVLMVWLFARKYAPTLRGHLVGGFAFMAGVWLALAIAGTHPGWPTYYILMGGWAMAGLIALPIKNRTAAVWARTFALLVATLALLAAWDDPHKPYASAGGAMLAAIIFAALAIRDRHVASIIASTAMLHLAGLFMWVAWGTASFPEFAAVQIACLASGALIWYPLDRRLSLPFREAASAATAVMLALLAGWGIEELFTPRVCQVPGIAGWVASGLAMAAALLGLLAPRLRLAAASIYTIGLSAVAFGWLESRWPVGQLFRPAIVTVADYVLLAQIIERIWSRRTRSGERSIAPWFAVAQFVVAALVILLSFPASLGAELTVHRMAGPLALAILIATTVLLALRSVGPLARGLENAAFGLAVLLLAEVGWATSDAAAPWLHGAVSLLAALGLVAVMTALVAPRLIAPDNRWAQAARRVGPILAGLGIAVLAVVLAQEVFLFQTVAGDTPLSPWETGLVAVAMLGLVATCLAFAVRPGLDPFGLSGSGRKGYVYAAEAILALLFLHIRLNIPDLLPARGGFGWSVTVMAIAFAGVGLAEFFRRRHLEVLADPIHRTGVFLPALPLIAFWLMPAPGGEPASLRSYSMLWLSVGTLYGVLALTRRSYLYTLCTALAMNAALWAVYADEGIGFLVHPQLWLVPLALIVLVSEYYHRDHLAKELAAGLRYGGLALLYLSSTADLIVAGPGQSAPLLLVLAVLSVIGALAGILLRIRAYLYLGSGFLILVVFRMIWHAAVEREQTWIWWACGILLGMLVLALFALLERRGQKMRDALERFRGWR